MKKESEFIVLFDLDGTLCDYDSALFKDLEKIRSPKENKFFPPVKNEAPDYIKNRVELIRSSTEWWANLPKHKLGFDIWNLVKKLGYRTMILTQAPLKNSNAWAGKKVWIDKNLSQLTEVTMTRDKGLVYGKVLVDDYPDYILRWLKWRHRGIVIMPVNRDNKNFSHPQVIKYNGKNLGEVKKAIIKLNKMSVN